MSEQRLAALEKLVLPLEVGPQTTSDLSIRQQVCDYTDDYLERVKTAPAFVPVAPDDIVPADFSVTETPSELPQLLSLLDKQIDRKAVTVGQNYLAFIPGSSTQASALGDYIAAITNSYTGVSFAAPGGAALERELLSWMASFIGYANDSFGGDLTSGGSVANLSAIVTARKAHRLKSRDYDRCTVYLSDQTHHSIDKALRIAGMEECVIRRIGVDTHYRMDVGELKAVIATDQKAGLIPWLVVASAGTTDMGVVDPLNNIAGIATSENLWFHVDAAYGGAFALCEEGKRKLDGIEKSDSVTLDAHKGLFVPFGSGAVLVKERRHLLDAQHYSAAYMQDTVSLTSLDQISQAEMSIELSRPFRGLRLWLPLRLAGVGAYRAALEEKLLLAQYFYKRLNNIDGFETGPAPDLSIVTFRYNPPAGNKDEFNTRLLSLIQEDGRVFLSSTIIAGEFTIRMAALNISTHKATMDLALNILQEKVASLLGETSR